MGVLFDYFSAPDDETAASCIDWPGGPSVPPAPPAPSRRGLFRRAVQEPAPSLLQPFEVVDGKGIDPVVMLGTLEEELTGVAYDDVTADPRCGLTLAVRNGGERIVGTVTDTLAAALASADETALLAAAGPWSNTEEFYGSATAQDLLPFLRELSALAARARPKGHRLYCWTCV